MAPPTVIRQIRFWIWTSQIWIRDNRTVRSFLASEGLKRPSVSRCEVDLHLMSIVAL